MKCPECGTPMKARKESYRYAECGLKHGTLVGVEVARCPRCGNYEISIPHIEELHRLLAKILIEKSTRFTGDEIRFLRKSLGWSGSDFAKHMGVAEETVSRWENDAAPIGPQADPLLRFLVARGVAGEVGEGQSQPAGGGELHVHLARGPGDREAAGLETGSGRSDPVARAAESR